MIQLNLLPDVKLEYLKAQRTRRLVVSIAVIVTLASVGLLVLLLSFSAIQKKNLSDLNNDIRTDTQKLKQQKGIDKILTVQNQLQSLTSLHASKPAATRLFEFLNQVTPAQLSISSFLIDFTQQQITITGTADSLSSVNKYVDTLKFTKYGTGEDKNTKAFSNVVLSSFSISTSGGQSNQPATYSVTLKYNPEIFDLTKKVQLSVPTITTTRASVDTKTDLFQPAPATTNKGN